jgi:hypothetical protein
MPIARVLATIAFVTVAIGCTTPGGWHERFAKWNRDLDKTKPVAVCPDESSEQRPVRVEVHAAGLDANVRAEIEEALVVSVHCEPASYDPVTEQGRWPYWITLKHLGAANRSPLYSFRLTKLSRKVSNQLNADPTGDTRAFSVQEFQLDVLRAQVDITAEVSFPCAEMLPPPPLLARRARSGIYTVERIYSGDVVFKSPVNGIRFAPVDVSFDVRFTLPPPAWPLADAGARDRAVRPPEWAGLSDRCETCKPVVICESLRSTKRFEASRLPLQPGETPKPYTAGTTSEVHVMTGVTKRPVIVDSVLAERKRTVACTTWTPMAGTAGPTISVATDSTDEGLPAASPYLAFHHVVKPGQLTPGCWSVQVQLGEIVGPAAEPTDGERASACRHGSLVFEQRIVVGPESRCPDAP